MMLLDIFDSEKQYIENGWFIFVPNYLTTEKANDLFHELYSTLPWKGGEIKIFGKTHAIPRKEVYFSDNQKQYSYSGKTFKIDDWNENVKLLKNQIGIEFKLHLNACLCNLYENGSHSNGWHADNEKELGRNPIIASLSLGETRRFHLKHNDIKKKYSFDLNHGSLLIMGGEIQHFYKHTVPKQLKVDRPRINLTFRKIT